VIARWNSGVLRRMAALARGRTIGLYGGSFNPAHSGHLHVAKEALKRLKLDEIWFLVSPGNPLKPQANMAPLLDRFRSLETLLGDRPNLKVLDIESQLGTRYTADTVTALQAELPATNFVWLMGADNLKTFAQWYQWEKIANALPIAVFDRTGYDCRGFACDLARHFAKFRVPYQRLNQTFAPAWTFVTIARHKGSATALRDQQGENWFEKHKREGHLVANIIGDAERH